MSAPNGGRPPPKRFLDLPSEIRNLIYEQVLESEMDATIRSLVRHVLNGEVRPISLRGPPMAVPRPRRPNFNGHRLLSRLRIRSAPRRSVPRELAFMQVNRQLRQEIGSIFYGTRTMRINGAMSDIPTIADYLRGVRARDTNGPSPFASLTINLTDVGWQSLQDVLPLLELLRGTDLSENIVLLSHGGRRSGLAASLQRSIGLAARARAQGWDAVRLQREVQQWADGERRTDAAVAAAATAKQQAADRRKRW